VVKEWYSSLKGDAKKFAKQLVRKIGDIPIAKESERIELRDRYTLMALGQPAQLAQSIRDFT
jgi:protein involved in ribonucleotide reduction